jgi:hypothetical protein
LSEISTILRCRGEKLENDFERQRILNYELAGLISFAFHQPGKMPKYKENKAAEKKGTEVDDIRVRAFFIGLAQQSESGPE